ncbi:MAG: GTP-binding protein [Marinilabiliaceae bacterium]|nr:GTP-binding protein [Marinilabiliaceae bacterium]
MNNTIPVLLLTGYLGSGKTTLVNHILSNQKGIRFAVIVNDIGEVNIDADLIQKGGIVDKKDDSLMALQNGCICCTLKMDLVQQLDEIMQMQKFDYILIEASGICEPAPIAQTICNIPQLAPQYTKHGLPRIDCIATVVDALRLESEFNNGDDLKRSDIDEEDLENLVIQQIEFCNLILLNKASEVTPTQLEHVKQVIKALQPKARIITTDYCNVELEELLNTGLFDFEAVASSAAWIQELDKPATPEEEEEAHSEHHHHDHKENEEHEHHHHHHHDHDHGHDECDHDEKDCHDPHCHHHHHHDHEGGEVEEYGISTFVYYRRKPFDIDMFDQMIARKWSKNIIRAKGICYFKQNRDMSYIFEQAGIQKKLTEAGLWFCTAPEDELKQLVAQNPEILNDWDETYGDRMQKIVFIGQKMDKEAIIRELDSCLC